ncbi:hypothetical protein ANTPLA_LOCUS11223 [Anthophora plagiata]
MPTNSEGNGSSVVTASTAVLERVNLRIPDFTPDDPELWFCVLERNFAAGGITSDGIKASYVTGALGPRYIDEVRDILLNPPSTGLYYTLKRELIRRLSVSQEQKARRLLEHEEIGDRKPSQFLRHLRGLAGTCVSESLLRTLWLGRLPRNVQAILATQKDTALDKVAELADAITDTMPGRPLVAETTFASAPGQPGTVDSVTERMMQLLITLQGQTEIMQGQIAELRASRGNHRPFRRFDRRRSSSRRRFNSRERSPASNGQSLLAASDSSPMFRRLFVLDRRSDTQFLVDTGADLCVFPRKLIRGPCISSEFQLSAANGTPITTYGTKTITLNLGLRRDFTWRFIVAEVSRPIIGADFLAHFGLLVDVRTQRLIDQTTTLTSRGAPVREDTPSIKQVQGESIFHKLLQRFPDITKPCGTPTEINHGTCHFIRTTPGPPVACKPRRLAPDRLKIAKKEFEDMVRLGLARPPENVLSRIEAVERKVDFEALAMSQSTDPELRALMQGESGLIFEQMSVPGSNVKIFCDVSTSFELSNCKYVFLRRDSSKAILQAPYDGPYEVISRTDKVFTIKMGDKNSVVSINRVKPAFSIAEEVATPPGHALVIPWRISMPPITETAPRPAERPATTAQHSSRSVPAPNAVSGTTRSGRRVRFPDRYQAGFP